MTTVDARRTVNALRALAARLEAGDVAITPDGLICVYLIDAPSVSVAALLGALPDPVFEIYPTDRTRCTVSGPLLTMRLHLELRLTQALPYLQAPATAGVS